MLKGWTGKRLRVDLTLRKTWSENIPEEDLRQCLGGRGINASFFCQHFSLSNSSPESPIAFAVGPLTGTLAPCSGWTSIASLSPFSEPPRYAFTRMAGHFGVPIKSAGFDQCVLQGKADRPLYLWIDNGKVKFEEAGHLWGKGTTETTVAIQEEKGDRSIEVLCIGPAGEKKLPLANVIHRLSWTGDHLGLGYLFGVKNLKAIAIRGKKPVTLHDPKRFLNLCLTLKERIQKNQKSESRKEGRAFSLSGQPSSAWEQQWVSSLSTYLSGQESCFSCPVHCGRNIEHEDKVTGGIHLEKIWHLGPAIGVYDADWTLKLHRLCQSHGLDPFLSGSLLAKALGENGVFSDQDPGQTDHVWENGEKAFILLSRIINDGKNGFRFTALPRSKNDDLDVLSDIFPFCKIVVSRLNRGTASNMIDLIHAATGYALSIEDLQGTVRNILRMESFLQNREFSLDDPASFSPAGEGQLNQNLNMEERNHEPTIDRTTS